MPRYTVNLGIKVKIWQNNSLSFNYDGTEEELKALLESSDDLPDFDEVDYHDTEFDLGTEEGLTAAGEGFPVIEVQSITEDDDE